MFDLTKQIFPCIMSVIAMQQKSKLHLNSPEEKYYYSVIYAANHLTVNKFQNVYHITLTYISVNFRLAYMNSYLGGTIPMLSM